MKPSSSLPRYRPPQPAITLGGAEQATANARYATLLVGFMRLMALLWLAQGLWRWSAVLTGDPAEAGGLETLSDVALSAILFFAVFDFIAAVGLWLASAWGGVVWLVTVAVQWLAILILPGFFEYDRAIGLADAGLVALYLFLTYRAGQEQAPFT